LAALLLLLQTVQVLALTLLQPNAHSIFMLALLILLSTWWLLAEAAVALQTMLVEAVQADC
jgi:hypothetical protein